MFSDVFLAQTSGEMEEFLPKKTAYMACHFSPYGKGLSNTPISLPANSLLLLDDSMPPSGHDPKIVADQLRQLVDRFSVQAMLLDFQNEKTDESANMVSVLLESLPCPVAATVPYAKVLHCPVFLSPPPANVPLQSHLSPWLKQGVYLEIAPSALEITVTETGSTVIPVPYVEDLPLEDRRLYCHYKIAVSPEKVVFTLSRTKEDLSALAQRATSLGVAGTVGLYQELNRL